MPLFGGDWTKIVASTNEGKVAFLSRFFSDAAREPTGQLRDGFRKAMSRIVAEFYAELRTTRKSERRRTCHSRWDSSVAKRSIVAIMDTLHFIEMTRP